MKTYPNNTLKASKAPKEPKAPTKHSFNITVSSEAKPSEIAQAIRKYLPNEYVVISGCRTRRVQIGKVTVTSVGER